MPGPILPVEKGQQVKNRGAKMTAKKRALDYPDGLEALGDDELWCKFCNVPVQHKEKSTATGHVRSAKHQRHKLVHTTIVFKPGAAAMVLDAPKSTIVEGTESSTSATLPRFLPSPSQALSLFPPLHPSKLLHARSGRG